MQRSALVLVASTVVPVLALGAAPQERAREPLPIDAAIGMRSHNGRSSFALSSDGEWLAHTVGTPDTMERHSALFARTGFPFAEGSDRMEATLTNTRTREAVRLGGASSASWGPVFSPDGSKVAFYSDEGGEAGLWIWDRTRGGAARVGGFAVRPMFGFEYPRFSPDGSRVMVKLVPEGLTVEQANERGPMPAAEPRRFPEVGPDEPSVHVRSVTPTPESTEEDEEDPAIRVQALEKDGRWADLAVVDLASAVATRLVRDEAVRSYAFSPDGTRVAYTLLAGFEPATQQPIYHLEVQPAGGGEPVRLGTDLRLSYGFEFSFSPDGATIAYLPSGQMAQRAVAEGDATRMVLISVADASVRALADADVPSLDPGDGELEPLWSADGKTIYGVGDGQVWAIDVATSRFTKLTDLPEWRVRSLVQSRPAAHPFSNDGGRTLWAVARERDGARSAIWAIDAAGGGVRTALQERRTYGGIFSVHGREATGEIVFTATDQQHPYDAWIYDTGSGQVRQASSLNPEIERYELGRAEVIRWRGIDGAELRGTLLLPPGFEVGSPVPLVVWVYAGEMGSTYANRFGIWGDMATFNMHLLATRGYAVLYPDVPVNVGTPVRDLMNAVMPGVNAAIEQGYADPERLAVMGQSYGSYNVLVLITETTRFKAAIITAAVLHPDLFADYLGSTGYYEQGQGNMGGSIWEFPDRYRDNSPLFRFDRIATPLLIGQGEQDGDLAPSEAIFQALERLGKPVEYRLYEAEGHVITRAPNVRDFWRRRLQFLAEHLDLQVDDQGAIVRR